MAKDTRINVTLDFGADVGDLKGAVANIQKSLQGLTLPQNLGKNFLNLFSSLEAEIKNFGSLTEKNLSTVGDFSAIEKSGKKILEMFRKLGVEVDGLSGTKKMDLFPPDTVTKINKINNAMKTYSSSISKNKKAIDEAKQNIAKYTAELIANEEAKKEVQNKKVVDPTVFSKASAEVKKYREEVEALQAALDEKKVDTQVRMEKDGRTTPDKRTKEYKAEQATLQQLEVALERLTTARANLNSITTETRQENQVKKLTKAYNEAELNLNRFKEELAKLGDGEESAAFQKMMESLKGVEGIDTSTIKSFQDLENVLNDIVNKAGADADDKIKAIAEAMARAGLKANQFGDHMDDTSESLKDVGRQAEDIENLKRQLLDFFSIGNAVQLFKRAVSSAFDTVKELDATMTEAAVVTEFSIGDMWDKLPEYSGEAQKLGATINDLYGATTLYYQQGLKTNEAMSVGIETMKMARIAGMESEDATKAMTAALRGFNMELNETSATRVNDVYSELAAITAADTAQISTAMSKTASIAANANMEFENTAAFLSQIIETTQEAPETAGTAVKTIIARFSEVKKLMSEGQTTGTDEEGEIIDVNKIQTALRTVGISMDEFFKGTEGLDDVFLRLAEKWETLDFETQRYIATTAAGSRQQSRFIAMMSDYDRTMELVGAANNSAGASQEQFNKTLDSLESKLNQLKDAWDTFVMGLANNEIIKAGVDLLTGFLNTVNEIISAISGGSGIVKTFVTAFAGLGAFKLGKGAIAKFMGDKMPEKGIFAAIFGKNANTEGLKGGEALGATIGKGVRSGIDKVKGTKLKDILLDKIGVNKKLKGDDLTKSFGLDELSKLDFSKVTPQGLEDLKSNIADQLADLPKDLQDAVKLDDLVNATDITGIQNALGPAGDSIKIVGQDAANAGVQMQKMSASMQTVGIAAGAAGGALMMLAGFLEEAGASDEVVTVIKTLGIALMGVSVIMPIVTAGFQAAGAVGVASGLATQAAWWWLMLIVAAVALLVGGLIAAGQAAKKASLAGQLEAAQKATEAAAEAANKAKEAYDDLLSSRDEYGELQSQLEGLTKGTDEWKQALIAANQQVLELLTTYPQLAGYLERGEDGQLAITNEGWDKVIEDQEKAVRSSQSALISSQMEETRIKGKIDQRDKLKDFDTGLGYSYDYAQSEGYGEGVQVLYETQGYEIIEGQGSDSSLVYNKNLMDQLRSGIQENPSDYLNAYFDENGNVAGIYDENGEQQVIDDPSSNALQQLANSSGKTAEEIYNLIGSLNAYDAAMLSHQTQLQSQAEALLMTGQSQEAADYEYNEAIISGFAKYMTTDTYAAEVDQLKSEKIYREGKATEDDNRKTMLAEYGIEATGDEKKDMEALYKAVMGASEIPEELKDNYEGMADAVANAKATEERVAKMEEFQTKAQGLDDDKQKQLATLMSGNASMMTIKELGNLEGKTRSQFIEEMGYTQEEAQEFLGYTEPKSFTQMDYEDKQALLENKAYRADIEKQAAEAGFVVDETEGAASPDEQLQEWLKLNGHLIEISADVQMDIDDAQFEQQLQDQKEKAEEKIKSIDSSFVLEGSVFEDMSPQALDNIAKQTSSMGKEGGKEYLNAFNTILESPNLSPDLKNELSNYISSVDWSDSMSAIQSFDYLEDLGLDSSEIVNFWTEAADAANFYVKSAAEAARITEYFQGKFNNREEAIQRLIDGEGTAADIEMLEKAGIELDKVLKLTSKGWQMKEADAQEASKLIAESDAQEATEVRKAHEDTMAEMKEISLSDSALGKAIAFTSFRNGDYTLDNSKEWAKMDDQTQTAVAQDLVDKGFMEARGGTETEDEYLARAMTAYNNFLQGIATASETAWMNQQNEQMMNAQLSTADQLSAEGGTDQEVRWAMEGEAERAGLDSAEVSAYADNLAETYNLEQQMADRIAIDNAKMRKGVEDLASGYADWAKEIEAGPANPKYQSSVNALRKTADNLLGTTEGLSDEWLTNAENMKLFEKAAEGDLDAVEDLQKSAAKEIAFGADFDEDSLTTEQQNLNDLINDFNPDDFEIGATLDSTGMTEAFQALLNSGQMTAEQVNAALEQIGFEPEITMESVTLTDNDITNGYVEVPSGRDVWGAPTGKTRIPLKSGMSVGQTIEFPVINGNSTHFKGSPKATASAGNKGGGGGSGGGKEPKEPETKHWKNPYDPLYNTLEELTELQRDRNDLEREYNRLLEDGYTDAQALNKAINEQAKSLSQEIVLQQKIATFRKDQLRNVENETHIYSRRTGEKEEDGTWKTEEVTGTFASAWKDLDMQAALGKSFDQLFKYNEKTGERELDYETILKLENDENIADTLTDEQGALLEEMISRGEELADQIEEAEDAIKEAEDALRELEKIGKQEALDEQNEVMEALKTVRQMEIDSYSTLSEALDISAQNILNSLQESIDLERQIRDNTKKEEDIAEMESRLSYLRADTSGANQLEIKQLEEQLADSREQYQDTLIDQELERLNQATTDAAEQRQQQIEIMQSQLEYAELSGELMNEAVRLLEEGTDDITGKMIPNSELETILKRSQNYEALSKEAKMNWMNETNEKLEMFKTGMKNWEIESIKDQGGTVSAINDSTGKATNLTYDQKTGKWKDKDGGTFASVTWDQERGSYVGYGYTAPPSATPTTNTAQPTKEETKTTTSSGYFAKMNPAAKKPVANMSTSQVKTLQRGLKAAGFNPGEIDGKYGSKTRAAVKQLQKAVGVKQDGDYGQNTHKAVMASKYKKYATGGLADYTGLAWLDGTKSRPELVLNAQDTKNFIALKDILSDLMRNIGSIGGSGGDNYFEINIQVDELANDYDVDRLTDKIKRELYNDGMSRNVNVISLQR